jgi:hypothetical protein
MLKRSPERPLAAGGTITTLPSPVRFTNQEFIVILLTTSVVVQLPEIVPDFCRAFTLGISPVQSRQWERRVTNGFRRHNVISSAC